MASGEELVLNLNKAIVNPANAEPAALLSLTIESAQSLPAGVTAEYPTNPLLAMSQSCVPLTACPRRKVCLSSCFLAMRKSLQGRSWKWSRTWCSPTGSRLAGYRHRRPTLNAPAITLFPAADRLTLGVPANTCLERAEVFNLSGQRVHEEAFSEEQGNRWTCPPCPRAPTSWSCTSTTRALRSSWSSGDSNFSCRNMESSSGRWLWQRCWPFSRRPQGHGRRWWTQSA